MRSGTANVNIQLIPFINDIRNERVFEMFRSARNPIEQINMLTRTSY